MEIINSTDRYRLDALVELARTYPESLRVAEVARRRGIPEQFLARLVAQLVREGAVLSTRGPKGGVRLAAAPSEISVASLFPEAARDSTGGGPGVMWLRTRLADSRAKVMHELSLESLVDVERAREATLAWEI